MVRTIKLPPTVRADPDAAVEIRRPHFKLNEVEQARYLITRFHYSRSYPPGIILVGTFHEDGGLFGDSGPAFAACAIGTVSTPQFPTLPDDPPLLELRRLVCRPGYRTSLTSLISLTLKWVRRKRLGDLIVSYADTYANHHGGIYQAASWFYDSVRKPQTDFLVNGEKRKNRVIATRYGTTDIERLRDLVSPSTDIRPVRYGDGKYLYWRPLTKAGRRQAERLGLEANPYPKPSEMGSPNVSGTGSERTQLTLFDSGSVG